MVTKIRKHFQDEDMPYARSKAELVRTMVGVVTMLFSLSSLVILMLVYLFGYLHPTVTYLPSK